MSGSVNTHLEDREDDLYLIFAYLYLLFMTFKDHTLFIELKNKQFALKRSLPALAVEVKMQKE